MYSILRIEGDPTSWTLSTPIEAGQVPASAAPVALPVSAPLAGRLLMSPRSMGSAVLLEPPPDDHGHVPSDAKLPSPPCMYLPSTAGAGGSGSLRYLLPPSADLAALEAEIAAAMSAGTFVTVDLTGPANTGVVVLNGAALPFVVLCPAGPQG